MMIYLLDVPDVKIPRRAIAIRDGDARIVRNDLMVNRLYSFRICLHPSHLDGKKIIGL